MCKSSNVFIFFYFVKNIEIMTYIGFKLKFNRKCGNSKSSLSMGDISNYLQLLK